MMARREVLLQDSGDLVWEAAKDGAGLMRNQTLMTREGARAEIAFSDGSGLVVGENSLLRLDRSSVNENGGRISVSLLRGTISTRRRGAEDSTRRIKPARLEVRIGERDVRFAGDTELTIMSSPEAAGGASVTVKSGRVEVASGDHQIVAGEGDQVLIPAPSQAKAPVVKKPPILLLEPGEGAIVRVSDASPSVRFRWKARSLGPFEFEVSRDPAFSRDVVNRRVTSDEVKIPLDAGAGEKWYWRVNSDTTGEFSLVTAPTPTLLYPPNRVAYPPGASIDYVWAPTEGAERFEIKLTLSGSSEDEKQSERNESVSGTRFRMTSPAVGSYEWKVRAVYRDQVKSRWSEGRVISIVDDVKPPPPPPAVLFEPEFETQGSHDQSLLPHPSVENRWSRIMNAVFPTAFAAESGEKTWTVRLHWEAVPGAKRYRVQVSRTRSFSSILSEAEVNEPTYGWVYQRGLENSKGRVFYRVASLDVRGESGGYSEPMAVPIPKQILESSPSEKKGKVEVHAVTERPIDAPAPEEPDDASSPPLPPRVWSGTAAVHTGIGNASQSSAATEIQSVSTDGAFLQQRLTALARMSRGELTWIGMLNVSAAGFGPPSGRPTLQQDIQAWSWSVSLARSLQMSGLNGWRLYAGASLSHPFRWAKSGPQSVDTAGGFTLGPMVRIMKSLRSGNAAFWVPAEVEGDLAVPLAGPLMGGPFGLSFAAAAEWKLLDLWKNGSNEKLNWLGLRFEAGISHLRWSNPEGTGRTDWATWVAPVFHFNE